MNRFRWKRTSTSRSKSVEDDEPIGEVERENATSAADDSEGGRRRRRRRKRRGGERSPAENAAPSDAPQPTDDGLAVVAEIGGDLSTPVASEPNGERNGWRAEGGERGRRSRRSRGRHRYPRVENGAEEGAPGETAFGEPAEASHDATTFQDATSQGNHGSGNDAQTESSPFAGEAAALEQAPMRERPVEAHAVAPVEQAPASPDDSSRRPRRPRRTARAGPVELSASEKTEPRIAAHVEPAPETAPAADEPARPRRSGWWQRARATLVGD